MWRKLVSIPVAVALCFPLTAADRKSWNKIRYVGGTLPVRTSPYDWNTTLTVNVNPDLIQISIAPAKLFSTLQTVRIKPSQIISLSAGAEAWRRVSEVKGSRLPSKAPSLFGLLENHAFFGIVYETDDAKRGGILLDSYYSWHILAVLKALTGKEIDYGP